MRLTLVLARVPSIKFPARMDASGQRTDMASSPVRTLYARSPAAAGRGTAGIQRMSLEAFRSSPAPKPAPAAAPVAAAPRPAPASKPWALDATPGRLERRGMSETEMAAVNFGGVF